MPFDVWDFRKDVRNLVIRPEIRARILRMEPGEVGPRHSHDVGDEIFLVLQGQCEFEIEGDRKVLGPGEICFAAVGEMHGVRVVGDEPMTMYLSVTPHLEPTHTFWDEQGNKLPPRYGVSTLAERKASTAPREPIADLADRFTALVQTVADRAITNAAAQRVGAARLTAALSAGDNSAAKAALDEMWPELLSLYQPFRELEAIWNTLAATVADEIEPI